MKRDLNHFWTYVSAIFGATIVVFAIKQIFLLQPFDLVLLENSYFYILLGISLAQVYISHGISKKASEQVVWYDIVFAVFSLVICFYFSYRGYDITSQGWMFAPPHWGITLFSFILCILVLEALRRASGIALFTVCTVFLFYPCIAHKMPGFLEGQGFTFFQTLTFHALSPQSIVGLVMRVVALLLIGYIIIGIVLMHTGGGQFFLDFATSVLGRFRGGAGKVAVLSSALFGSMSGSSISNVVTTGSITIPAMKRSGFPAHYAGAIEACASSGGVLMPPIMGAVAFIMASFLNVPYFTVVVAAIVPSFLYYLGLLIQLDAFAANEGIKGLNPSEISPLKEVLFKGWQFAFALVILVYFLYLRLEAHAPFYAIIFLLAVCMYRKETRLDLKGFVNLLKAIGQLIAELTVTIGAVGFVIGSLSLTGVGAAISGELVSLAGGNVYLMLIFGALASFVLGMGMTTSACYIFLAIILAPGLVSQGFNPLAVHLFVLYWAMASNITPPVALACIPAASIANAKYSKVGFVAMHFGFVKYIVPFIFVLQPALILEGTPKEVIYALITALTGIALASEGLGRNLIGIGKLSTASGLLLTIFGLFVALPLGIWMKVLGLVGTIILVGVLLWRKKEHRKPIAILEENDADQQV